MLVGKLLETVTKAKTSQALSHLMSLKVPCTAWYADSFLSDTFIQADVAVRVDLDEDGTVVKEEEIDADLLMVLFAFYVLNLVPRVIIWCSGGRFCQSRKRYSSAD